MGLKTFLPSCVGSLNHPLNLNVAKVGGLQSQGVKGEAVFVYRKFLTTQDLKPSGFPVVPFPRGPMGQKIGKNDPILLVPS
jgi:hypothetical protein